MTRLTRAVLAAALTITLALPLAAANYPPAVQRLVEQGVEITGKFAAPGGLTGYGARADGRELILYVTPDGKHVIAGTMLDSTGRNLSEQHVKDHVPPPNLEAAWAKLERATWIADGPARSKRVVYVFDDPNCPYCNALWRASRPYLEKGVQLRHVMVAILGPTSPGKAAAILAAADPAEALARHGRDYAKGGIAPIEKIDARVRAQIDANNALMQELGVHATPAIFYRDAKGRVRSVLGMPNPSVLARDIFQLPETPVADLGRR